MLSDDFTTLLVKTFVCCKAFSCFQKINTSSLSSSSTRFSIGTVYLHSFLCSLMFTEESRDLNEYGAVDSVLSSCYLLLIFLALVTLFVTLFNLLFRLRLYIFDKITECLLNCLCLQWDRNEKRHSL